LHDEMPALDHCCRPDLRSADPLNYRRPPPQANRTASNLSRRLHRVVACIAVSFVCIVPGVAGAQPTPTSAPSSAAAGDLLAQFATAWAHVTAYTATVTVMERKDAQTQNIVLEYTFRKPSSVTVHVDAGWNAGVTMVWDGGTTVVAHRGSGLAALFKKTLALHDPQATTIRGSSIDQLGFGAVLEHARQQAGALTETPQSAVYGASVDSVTLVSADPSSNAGLTREVVELSASTHLPVRVLGYDDATLVRQIDFSKVVLAP
jgi:outer membrane lipoprotein-sorting protein